MAQNHTIKGSFEPCMIVPAVTEVCLPQAAHSKVKGFPPCGQPLGPAHAGHRNPEGQRAALSQAAQASSLGNWRWNSTSEVGKLGMAGPLSEPNVHVMFLPAVLDVPVGNSASEYLATDADVLPLDIASGRFVLTAEARRRGATGLRWATYSNTPDADAYWELRDNIYNNRSVWDLWKWPRAAGCLIFVGLMVFGVYLDRKDIAGKREGKNLKGPVLVTPEQFNLAKQGDGIGIKIGPAATMLRVRARDECQHFSIMGDTGSGKSVLITQLLDQVRERGEPAVIYDPATEFIPRYYRDRGPQGRTDCREVSAWPRR